jgi:hypothetical protein
MGFVIRVAAGTAPIDVKITPWAIACTFLLALVLVLEKRRGELAQTGVVGGKGSTSSRAYSDAIVDRLTAVAAGSLIIVYSVYSILDGSAFLIGTIPLAACGLIRYHTIVRRQTSTSEIEIIFKDAVIVTCIIAWLALVLVTFSDL